MAPGLLVFLKASFFLVFNFHEVGLFCFNNELAALNRNKNPDLDFPDEMHLNFPENPLHLDLAGISLD